MSTVTNYLGPSAIFEHAYGDWSCFDSGVTLCRQMHFKSKVDNSTISEFSVLGYMSGKVTIAIFWKKTENEDASFINFLEANKIPVSELDRLSHQVYTGTHEALKIAYRILSENNQIPASHKEQIEIIVDKGSCQPWKPVGKENSLSFSFHPLFG